MCRRVEKEEKKTTEFKKDNSIKQFLPNRKEKKLLKEKEMEIPSSPPKKGK